MQKTGALVRQVHQQPVSATAHTSAPLVFLDPGHGGVDTGTISHRLSNGKRLMEKSITLDLALRTARLLRQAGFRVALSRTSDTLPGVSKTSYTHLGFLTSQGLLQDLEARVTMANQAHAALLLSIHVNGFSDPSAGGAETLYCATCSTGTANRRFALAVQQQVMAALAKLGYQAENRGAIPDVQDQARSRTSIGASYHHLIVLGPGIPGRLPGLQMPGALSEPLFLTNPAEARLLARSDVRQALAIAYVRAIEQMLPPTGRSSP